MVGRGGGEKVCECGVDGFKMLWIIFKPVEFAVDDAQLVKVEDLVMALDFGNKG